MKKLRNAPRSSSSSKMRLTCRSTAHQLVGWVWEVKDHKNIPHGIIAMGSNLILQHATCDMLQSKHLVGSKKTIWYILKPYVTGGHAWYRLTSNFPSQRAKSNGSSNWHASNPLWDREDILLRMLNLGPKILWTLCLWPSIKSQVLGEQQPMAVRHSTWPAPSETKIYPHWH